VAGFSERSGRRNRADNWKLAGAGVLGIDMLDPVSDISRGDGAPESGRCPGNRGRPDNAGVIFRNRSGNASCAGIGETAR